MGGWSEAIFGRNGPPNRTESSDLLSIGATQRNNPPGCLSGGRPSGASSCLHLLSQAL